MNRSQAMALVLILALIGNSLLHFFHPAYKEYRRMSDDVVSRIEQFRGEVSDSFIPVVSNIVFLLKRDSISSQTVGNVADSVKTSMPLVVGTRHQESAQLSYARCGDTEYVVLNGHTALTVGDNLFGYPIRNISKTSVLTDASLFLFTPSVSSSSTLNTEINNDNR